MGLNPEQLAPIQCFHKCYKRRQTWGLVPKIQTGPVHEIWDCTVKRRHNTKTLQGLGFISLLFAQNGDDLRPIKVFMNLVTAADKFIVQTFFLNTVAAQLLGCRPALFAAALTSLLTVLFIAPSLNPMN